MIYIIKGILIFRLVDNFNLYFDQNTFKAYPDAIYTTEPIPNNVITLIDTYKI